MDISDDENEVPRDDFVSQEPVRKKKARMSTDTEHSLKDTPLQDNEIPTQSGKRSTSSRKSLKVTSSAEARRRVSSSSQFSALSVLSHLDVFKSQAQSIIRRISMKNFLSYDSIQTRPGPKLNLIVGRNGAGKSTLGCAICLGLGGDPKILGRDSHLPAFVKRGKDFCVIEVELQQPDRQTLVVRRKVITRGTVRSEWKLNGRPATEESVKKKVAENNINLDNLCHFLPQNRVQDFGRLAHDGVKLLKETEDAVGYEGMVSDHEQLVSLSKKKDNDSRDIDNLTQQKGQREEKITQMEAEIQRFRKRQELAKKVELVDNKMLWVKATDAQKEKTEQKKVLEAAKQAAIAAESKFKDASNPIKALEKRKLELEKEQSEAFKYVKEARDTHKHLSDRLDREETLVETNKEKMASLLKDQRKVSAAIKESEAKISKLAVEISVATAAIPSAKEIAAQKQALDLENKRAREEIESAAARHDEAQSILFSLQKKSSELTAKINKFKSVREQRLKYLEQKEPDVVQAMKHLEKNSSRFRHPVIGPLALELNVSGDEHVAAFLDAVLSKRNKLAFLVQDEGDMQVFRDLMTEKMNRASDYLHCVMIADNPVPKPKLKLSEMKRFGIVEFLGNFVEGHPQVVDFLSTAGLYSHYIIDEHTTEDLWKSNTFGVMSVLQLTGGAYKHHFKKSKDAESAITTRTFEGATVFGQRNSGVDVAALETDLASISLKIKDLEGELKQAETARRSASKISETVNTKRKQLAEITSKLTSLTRSKDREEENLRNLKKAYDDVDIPNLQRKLDDSQKRLFATARKLPETLVAHLNAEKKYQIIISSKLILNRRLDREKENVRHLEQEVKTARRNFNEQKETLTAMKLRVKQLVQTAQRATGDLDTNPDLKKAFEELPGTTEELTTLRGELVASVAALRDSSDKQAEYETLRRELAEIETNLEKSISSRDSNATRITQIKSTWHPRLKAMISTINETFCETLSRIKIPGDILLIEDESDFSQFQLQIRVKFRDADKLAALDGQRQSGGETSLTTMVYLIALQKLTKVPFRVVDEINQGMDATNEKLVFERIVEHCCAEDSCQTFLITPKLQSNLLESVSDNVTVLCVHSGPSMLDDQQWKKSESADFWGDN